MLKFGGCLCNVQATSCLWLRTWNWMPQKEQTGGGGNVSKNHTVWNVNPKESGEIRQQKSWNEFSTSTSEMEVYNGVLWCNQHRWGKIISNTTDTYGHNAKTKEVDMILFSRWWSHMVPCQKRTSPLLVRLTMWHDFGWDVLHSNDRDIGKGNFIEGLVLSAGTSYGWRTRSRFLGS